MTIRSQRGSVMIPTLIGFFIVAILAASLMDTMNLNLKEEGNLREIVNVAESVQQALNVLRDPAICTNNLQGQSSTGGNLTEIRSGPGQVKMTVGDLVPTRTLQLKALRLHDYRAYTTGPSGPDSRGTMELDFVYEPPQGGISRRRAILVSTELDASFNIKTCVALGSAADYWRLTPASDIYFNNPVAIGDVSVPYVAPPDEPYKLYIAGYVQSQDYYHISDRRAKTHIRPLANHHGLAAIHGVRYKWRQTREASMGVLAQEVERVYPHAVSGGTDVMKAVDYDQLIAPLIDRVNALAEQNRDLSRRLKRLRDRAN